MAPDTSAPKQPGEAHDASSGPGGKAQAGPDQAGVGDAASLGTPGSAPDAPDGDAAGRDDEIRDEAAAAAP
jgi:hypothetical protein